MKALSIQQPWAWLIVNGYKGPENRTWCTSERGERLIHAGKKVDVEGYEWVRETFPDIPLPPLATLERGGIVGQANLTDCVTSMDDRFFFGPFGFVFEDPKPLPFRPLRGQLGFFDVPDPTATTDGATE